MDASEREGDRRGRGRGAVLPTFLLAIGLTPAGPVAGGWFAASQGAGVAAGSWMASWQSMAVREPRQEPHGRRGFHGHRRGRRRADASKLSPLPAEERLHGRQGRGASPAYERQGREDLLARETRSGATSSHDC